MDAPRPEPPKHAAGSPPPPGQRVVASMPTQHIGEPLGYARATWRLRLDGAVERPREWRLEELELAAKAEIQSDFHAGTGWSVLGVRWLGARLADILAQARVESRARFVSFSDGDRYDASLSIEDAMAADTILAMACDGAPLSHEHGAPLRLVAPAKYGWKSVKWLRRIEVLVDDRPGFWERRGLHPNADPWREERFA